MVDEILRVGNLVKYFQVKSGFFSKTKLFVHAVDDVSFQVERGETLGLVGESGSGKTTVSRCVLRLIEPTHGEVYFRGENLLKLGKKELIKARRDMSMVYQDPFSSLNPRFLVRDIIGEALVVNNIAKGHELENRVGELLERVGLRTDHMRRYPHEFSGGQRQRIAVARALALNPRLTILDEPTSALDVSVQAQILNLLKDLQKEFDLTYLFISHNLDVVNYMSDRIAVMYAGKILEIGPVDEVFESPLVPYTKALMAAIPVPNPEYMRKEVVLSGEVPSATNPPTGCRFHARCPSSTCKCEKIEPKLAEVKHEHFVACHNVT